MIKQLTAVMMALTLSSPAFAANDILNLNNRLKKSLNASQDAIKASALKKLCKKKAVKKKACYIRNIHQQKEFALVTVDKKGDGHFGFFELKNKKWKLKAKGPVKNMTVAYLGKKYPTLKKSMLTDLVGAMKVKEGGKK